MPIAIARAVVPKLSGDGSTTTDGRRAVTVPEAAAVLGLGRSNAYAAVRSGDIPSVRIGGRVLVSVAVLERLTADPQALASA